MPELNPEPSSLDSTTLDDTEYKTYIPGLKDVGGAISFGANFTNDLKTKWDALISAYEEGVSKGKATWFAIVHPKLEKAVFFKGQPVPMGMPGIEVDSVLETNLYITPTSAPTWENKPTQGT